MSSDEYERFLQEEGVLKLVGDAVREGALEADPILSISRRLMKADGEPTFTGTKAPWSELLGVWERTAPDGHKVIYEFTDLENVVFEVLPQGGAAPRRMECSYRVATDPSPWVIELESKANGKCIRALCRLMQEGTLRWEGSTSQAPVHFTNDAVELRRRAEERPSSPPPP
eukprot:Sspe_Gene.92593::Locus_65105_Transcript_1_1_Confidence_1.000_Length_614::g.92593::m.92593